MKRGQLAWIDSPFFSADSAIAASLHLAPPVERWKLTAVAPNGRSFGTCSCDIKGWSRYCVGLGNLGIFSSHRNRSQPCFTKSKEKRMTGATNSAMKRWAQHGQLNVGIVPTSETSNTDLGGSWPLHFLSLRETHLDTENTDLSMKRSKETFPFPTMSATTRELSPCHETRPI